MENRTQITRTKTLEQSAKKDYCSLSKREKKGLNRQKKQQRTNRQKNKTNEHKTITLNRETNKG